MRPPRWPNGYSICLVSGRSWVQSLAMTEKVLKLVVVAFPLGAKDYGNSTMTGRQCQHNGLVKYCLKVVKETWICELFPLKN